MRRRSSNDFLFTDLSTFSRAPASICLLAFHDKFPSYNCDFSFFIWINSNLYNLEYLTHLNLRIRHICEIGHICQIIHLDSTTVIFTILTFHSLFTVDHCTFCIIVMVDKKQIDDDDGHSWFVYQAAHWQIWCPRQGTRMTCKSWYFLPSKTQYTQYPQ